MIKQMDKKQIIERFNQFLPKEAVLYASEDLGPYECDGLSAYRQRPWMVVLPETEEEIVQILKICYQANIPVVARGAGTGLSGGALPLADGVLLSLAKLKKIIAVDIFARTAIVQPGVRNLAISEAVAPFELYYAPDPSSQIACTIGGNVAENSGGVHCLKYGLTVHNILKLRMVTIEGEILDIGTEGLDSPGYDLLALLTGSEGMLGVITQVTVKLLPKPQSTKLVMGAFDSLAKASLAVGNIIAAGVIPAGLEMMDQLAIQAAEDFMHVGYPRSAAAILLCEVDGMLEEVAIQIDKVNEVLQASGVIEVTLARDIAERHKLWAGRKAAFPAVGRIKPDYYCMDGTIPRRALPQVLEQIRDWSIQYNLPCANVFHAGDGNLHPLILFDANIHGEFEKAEAFGAEILKLCLAVGGTITGEHGVGVEKINQMCAQFNSTELKIFHGIKYAFDQKTLLNPGKAVPTLQRCAEFGAMHVQVGKEKFPELPRF